MYIVNNIIANGMEGGMNLSRGIIGGYLRGFREENGWRLVHRLSYQFGWDDGQVLARCRCHRVVGRILVLIHNPREAEREGKAYLDHEKYNRPENHRAYCGREGVRAS